MNVEILACTHTGLPYAQDHTVDGSGGLVANNGAAGLPSFTRRGPDVITRAVRPTPTYPPTASTASPWARLRLDALALRLRPRRLGERSSGSLADRARRPTRLTTSASPTARTSHSPKLPAARSTPARLTTPRPGKGGRYDPYRAVSLCPQRRPLQMAARVRSPISPVVNRDVVGRLRARQSGQSGCGRGHGRGGIDITRDHLPNPGPTRSSGPPMLLSPWAAVTPAPLPRRRYEEWMLGDPAGLGVERSGHPRRDRTAGPGGCSPNSASPRSGLSDDVCGIAARGMFHFHGSRVHRSPHPTRDRRVIRLLTA